MTVRQQIELVFREDLGLAPPVPGVDLITTGALDSLAIAGLLIALEQRFDVQVGLDDISLDGLRTLEGIERLLSDSVAARNRDGAEREQLPPVLVALREGQGRPVFLLHNANLGTNATRTLAGALQTSRPLYGLRAEGYTDGDVREASVEDMARAYADAIRVVQPKGPYTLTGFSFGGLIAYEMACILKREGQTVDLLAMLDPQAQWRLLPFGDRLLFRLTLPLRYARIALAKREKLLSRIRSLSPWGAKGSQSRAELSPFPEYQIMADRAEAAYRPAPYDGDVMLFVARRRSPLKARPERIWQQFIQGPLAIVRIEGDHFDINRGRVGEVAAIVTPLLEAGASQPG